MAPVIRKSPPESGIMGYFAKSAQFLREVRAELRKVTWPSRKQTIGSTLVVLVLVMIISFFLGVVDIGLSGLVRVVLQ
ncbi:MAG: preprotein translocase subunit SecE [Desulfobacteraceae bacterium 4572_88]|nr:MAG: preprotein translocase subunit SecE [Desulfobacteraceae bacterium 4572_88]